MVICKSPSIQTLLVVWEFVWFCVFHFFFAIYLFAAVCDRCLASLSLPLRQTICIVGES